MFKLFSIFVFLKLVYISPCFAASPNQPGVYWVTPQLIYSQTYYTEPGAMKETGGNGGLRIEVGYHLLENLSLSLNETYWDGRLQYDGQTFGGTPVQTQTSDYTINTQILLHWDINLFQLSIGYGRRYWYDNLIISYRRRTEYNYIPIKFTYFIGPYYYQFEYDQWLNGKNKSHMSDVDPSSHDIEVKQNSGVGLGLEFGWLIGSAPINTVFLQIHRWDIDASEIANDGTQDLVEPKNNTLSITLGLGMIF